MYSHIKKKRQEDSFVFLKHFIKHEWLQEFSR